jgi:hypothetical protein
MLWLARLITPLLGRLAGAPLLDLVEKLLGRADLKDRLKAETRARMIDRDRALIDARRAVLLAEQGSESWITRSWRPLLMFLLMAFLLFFGLIIPLMELALGRALPLEPQLERIPEPAWNLLALGLCGYVGGRSIEKIAAGWLAAKDQANRRSESARPQPRLQRKK